ncbi:HD-domain/PDEase-like protein [Wallemia mellicola]|uniref:Phosphodiesterase n=2 Tax=Wallemia mellicola TaxID=1708541 RepID=A0A4T0PPR4_9BASI|nr:HD-domain/PDEase-like protein [Wallemia mellicola CBS 633.66]TIB72501.1 hypothetical protein E3Q24_01624 [Wallemia mellicola]EIM21914.1 HD-domain/PDEase-like protein [Wallemia mellicola CBS 633.66]TIB77355.1 hypothetical protein E3Q23_01339 [Wallemia mellicola]TIB78881.1 HD-domain/PDEase-like protein [Wallemia mellicola]TIB85919.1 HD-domain/PDEase-like protein [Wallemia mellicola]|eukprot:XP_006958209.1 HD-domain/PDEase-like protein [Wallemia mellicola CBS 633.66]
MNELDKYEFPNKSSNHHLDNSPPSPGTSPRQSTQQIPLRSAISSSDRAFLRATGQQPSTSTTKVIPACFNNLNIYDYTDSRRKSVDVGGLARSNKNSKDGLSELIGDLFKKSTHLNEEDEFHFDPSVEIPNKSFLVDKLSTWSFQPLSLTNDDLFNCAIIIVESALTLPSLSQLNLSQFIPFLVAVRKSYSAPNAYHNYTHAIDVLQATYSFLVLLQVAPPISNLNSHEPWQRSQTGLASTLLSDWDVLSLLISAIGHDVGHPGLNNTFMNNAQTPLSEIYQSKSVLENMHCFLLVQLLRKHNLGFLIGASSVSSLSPFDVIDITDDHYDSVETNQLKRASAKAESEVTAMATATPNSPTTPTTSAAPKENKTTHDARKFRNLMSKTVLATDMSLHFDFMKMLTDMRERRLNGKECDEDLDRTLLLQALIKCADISNPARPYHVCEHWSKALLEEWAKQAALETQLSLPVTVFSSADPVSQAKSQVSFIDMFVQPLFQTLSDFLPGMKGVLEHCKKNKERWLSKTEKSESQKTSPPQATQSSPLVMSRNVSISSQGGTISGINSHRSSLSGAAPHHMFSASCCAGSTPLMSPSAEINLQFSRRSSTAKPIAIPSRRSSSISTDDSGIMRQTEAKQFINDVSKPSSTAPASNASVTAFDPRFRQLFPLSLPQALSVNANDGDELGGQLRSVSPGHRQSRYRVSWPASPYSCGFN